MCGVVLQVTVGRSLKAVVALRGLVIEWVLVRGFNEPTHTDSGKVSSLSSDGKGACQGL